jgi:hypothetical protein
VLGAAAVLGAISVPTGIDAAVVSHACGVGRDRGWLGVVVAVLATAVVFGVVVAVTGFVACGIAGCSGAGFGPVFAPRQAQAGLLVAGLSVLPLAVVVLRGRHRVYQVGGAAAAAVTAALVAMLVLGLGPNGCPWGRHQARAGAEALSPGSLTCSADPDALPSGRR